MKHLNIILIGILLIGLNGWIIEQQSHFSLVKNQYITQMAQLQRPNQKVTSTQSYIERGRIIITSDSGLNNSGVTGFKGNGTIDDPILIEGYNITSSGGTLISISSTTFYFRIANCLFNGISTWGDGIRFSNVIYGTIDNNIIINNGWKGIRIVTSSHYNTIANNTVSSKGEDGIFLDNSDNNLLINNTSHDNGIWYTGPYSDGIELTSSHNNTLENNVVYNNAGAGVNILHSYNNTIIENTAFTNSENGINIVNSSSSTAKTVTNNFAFENGWSGIGLANSKNYTIVNNTAYNNNQDGITMIDYGGGPSHNVTITSNILYDNNDYGIRLGSSTNNYISYNLIYNNDKYGINLKSGFDNNKIEMNDLCSNNAGGRQAYDEGLNNVFSKNYWSDWTGTGTYVIGGLAGNQDSSPQTNPYHLSPPAITSPSSTTSTLENTVTIQWTASADTYGHSMTCAVYYSTDDGTTWIKVVSGMETTNYTWDLTSIVDGTTVLIKVQTTDNIGFKSFSVTTGTFTIENPLLTSTTTTSTTSTSNGTPGWNGMLVILSLFVILSLRKGRKKS